MASQGKRQPAAEFRNSNCAATFSLASHLYLSPPTSRLSDCSAPVGRRLHAHVGRGLTHIIGVLNARYKVSLLIKGRCSNCQNIQTSSSHSHLFSRASINIHAELCPSARYHLAGVPRSKIIACGNALSFTC